MGEPFSQICQPNVLAMSRGAMAPQVPRRCEAAGSIALLGRRSMAQCPEIVENRETP
jgi:hypothetical protein